MTEVSRRTALGLAVGAVAAPLLPEALAAPAVSQAPLFPAWTVGTPGEFNWRSIFAPNAQRAIEIWAEAESIDAEDIEGMDVEAREEPGLDPDTEGEHEMSLQDARKLAWGHICDRCGTEAASWEWSIVETDAICDDCMTLADWQIADPEHAAELREEMEAEFWDEFSVTLERFFQNVQPGKESA